MLKFFVADADPDQGFGIFSIRDPGENIRIPDPGEKNRILDPQHLLMDYKNSCFRFAKCFIF